MRCSGQDQSILLPLSLLIFLKTVGDPFQPFEDHRQRRDLDSSTAGVRLPLISSLLETCC